MKKLSFLVGLGLGFLLGSRAGSGPFDRVQEKIQSVGSQPRVQETVDTMKVAVRDRVDQVADQVADQVGERAPGSGVSST